MHFFRTFKKSTAPYKVHNMGLRYIKKLAATSAGETKISVQKWPLRLQIYSILSPPLRVPLIGKEQIFCMRKV